MKVAILGAGNVGTALASSLTRAGHQVVIAALDPAHAVDAAAAAGARPAASNAAAVDGADVVIAAVPAAALPSIAADVGADLGSTPVIDATNRMAFGPDGPTMDTSISNAEELAALLPGTPVIKAFNTLFAANQADPTTQGVELDGYVAGDDAAAKGVVLGLVESIGLRPVDVGPLAHARQLESLAFLNIALNATNGGSWRSGWKLVGAPDTTGAQKAA
jgi:predicted dinucleotide-binding enzyme